MGYGTVYKGIGKHTGGTLRRKFVIGRAKVQRKMFRIDDIATQQMLRVAARKVANMIGGAIINKARANLKEGGYFSENMEKIKDTYPHIASRLLYESGFVNYSVNGLNLHITVGFDAPYATDVEYGVSPGESNVTVDDIIVWIYDKGLDKKLSLDERSANVFARRVVSKIKREGIPPTFFFKRAVRQVISNLKFNVRVENG